MIKSKIFMWLFCIFMSAGITTNAVSAPIDDLTSGYINGTWQVDNPEYTKLYNLTSNRKLVLSNVVEKENSTVAFYELSYDYSGGYYEEQGVLVLQHETLKLEFATVDESVIDAAMTGQLADVATTTLALSAGFSEGNPLVAGAISSPVGAAAIIALKLAAPALATNMNLNNCISTRTGLAAAGWGAAAWNLAIIAGSSTGVGLIAGILSGYYAAKSERGSAPVDCSGIYD